MKPRGLMAAGSGRAQALKPRTARRQKPLWRSPPLRLLSSRAVSYGRLPMVTCKAPITSRLHHRKTEIRFCSVSQSGFEPSLSGFVPAPTEANNVFASGCAAGTCGFGSEGLEFRIGRKSGWLRVSDIAGFGRGRREGMGALADIKMEAGDLKEGDGGEKK